MVRSRCITGCAGARTRTLRGSFATRYASAVVARAGLEPKAAFWGIYRPFPLTIQLFWGHHVSLFSGCPQKCPLSPPATLGCPQTSLDAKTVRSSGFSSDFWRIRDATGRGRRCMDGGTAGTRTQDQSLKRALLYQLSYRPAGPRIIAELRPEFTVSAGRRSSMRRATNPFVMCSR